LSGALPGSVHFKEGRVGLGRARRTVGRRPRHPRRQGLPGQHAREDDVPGEEQAGITERGKPRPREVRRPGERANAQVKNWRILRKLPLLPLTRRTTRASFDSDFEWDVFGKIVLRGSVKTQYQLERWIVLFLS
jgi:hypothetical protein